MEFLGKIKLSIIFFVIIFLNCGEVQAATTHYMRTDGNDANCTGLVDAAYPGSGSAQPCAWKTLDYALNYQNVSQGDTIKVGAGNYSSFSSYASHNQINPNIKSSAEGGAVVIEAYPSDANVIFDMPSNTGTGAAFVSIAIANWAELSFKNINFTNSSSVNTRLFWIAGHSLTFEDCSIDMNSAGQNVVRIGNDTEASSVTFRRTTIKNLNATPIYNTRTDGGTFTFWAESSLFYNFGGGGFSFLAPAHVTFRNNTFISGNNYWLGFRDAGSDTEITNNIFYINTSSDYYPIMFGVDAGAGYQYALDNPDKFVILNNIYYRPSGYIDMFYTNSGVSGMLPLSETNHWINPTFTSVAGNDYSIQSGSYICGRGLASALPSGGDINGDSWTGNDIGAFKCPTASSPITLQSSVAFVGDSIMAATPASYPPGTVTSYFYNETGVTVVDRSSAAISGAQVQKVFALVDTVMINNSPSTIFLSAGINNLSGNFTSAQETQLANYIVGIMKKIEAWGARPIWLGIGTRNNYGGYDDTNIVTVNDAIQTQCTTYGWSCSPYYNQMIINRPSTWQTDYYLASGNVHPSGTGHTVIEDVAEYLYYDKGTIGSTNINVSAGARIYADGKFRNKGTAGANTANLSITPQGGSFSANDKSFWIDVSGISWSNSGTRHKQWTESSTVSGLTNTVHTVGDLEANKYYNVTVDDSISNLSGTNCNTIGSDYICLSDSLGKIIFSYTGNYSTHTFDVIEGDNIPPSNVSISHITIDSPTQLTVVADTPTDSGSGLAAAPYWFQETTGHAGAVSSTDWQTSNSFTNSGLSSNIGYAYKVKVKDAAGNISEYSASVPQTPMAIGGGSSYTATTTPAISTTTTTTTVTPTTQEPAQQPTQPTQSTETTITQIKSQLIILLTQVIQMLTEQVALMR